MQIRAILQRAADQLDAALDHVRTIAEQQREQADDPVVGEPWEVLAQQDVLDEPEAAQQIHRAIASFLSNPCWAVRPGASSSGVLP